jgi:hypothetical protein
MITAWQTYGFEGTTNGAWLDTTISDSAMQVGSRSMSMWFRYTGTFAKTLYLTGYGNGGFGDRYQLQIGVTTAGLVTLQNSRGGSTTATSTSVQSIVRGQWHHVMGSIHSTTPTGTTFDRTQVWLDGIPGNLDTSTVIQNAGVIDWWIGGGLTSGANNQPHEAWIGEFTQACIWPYEMGHAEAQHLASGGEVQDLGVPQIQLAPGPTNLSGDPAILDTVSAKPPAAVLVDIPQLQVPDALPVVYPAEDRLAWMPPEEQHVSPNR